MVFCCLQFLLKNEQKQIDQRYSSIKVELVRLFFGRIVGFKKTLQICLTFNRIENSKTRVITEVTLLTLDGGVSLSMKPPKKVDVWSRLCFVNPV